MLDGVVRVGRSSIIVVVGLVLFAGMAMVQRSRFLYLQRDQYYDPLEDDIYAPVPSRNAYDEERLMASTPSDRDSLLNTASSKKRSWGY